MYMLIRRLNSNEFNWIKQLKPVDKLLKIVAPWSVSVNSIYCDDNIFLIKKQYFDWFGLKWSINSMYSN